MGRDYNPRKLAALLADTAEKIKIEDGDHVAQTATYSIFIEQWQNALESSTSRAEVSDLIDAASNKHSIDHCRNALRQADLPSIFADYLQEGKDPRVYFFEGFLRAYDVSASRSRGVHYSPPAVVSYITRSIDFILQQKLGMSCSEAMLLDPCCGVGTFLCNIGNYSRVVGLDVSAPACTLASRLAPHCEIRHADSLEHLDLGLHSKPLVVLGNPPYSGHSSNKGAVAELLLDYKQGLNERNPKWLQDDYVKFIRMAQHRIDQAGQGIVAFITNHSFLFNPTFRTMRDSLMSSFDEIYCLDLGGNAKINFIDEQGVDGNVFPIQMGVGISIFVKVSSSKSCQVKHASLSGSRKEKLNTLRATSVTNTQWKEVDPIGPFFTFTPVDQSLQREYYGFPSLLDIFPHRSVGFVTSRDSYAVDFDRNALLARISALRDPKVSPEQIQREYQITDLNVEKARSLILDDPDWMDRAVRVLYRPFDWRWAYLSRAVMERPRLPFMECLLPKMGVEGNIALAVGRAGQVTGSTSWDVVFCTDCPTDLNLFRRGGATLFPLFYDGRLNYCSEAGYDRRLFYYIYAMLHSTAYRVRYSEFLKNDYPRIPVTSDDELLDSLAVKGIALAQTHLMKTSNYTQAESETTLRIGGWDVPGKYLADRKGGRKLTVEEEAHLQNIRAALTKATVIEREIDTIVERHAPWLERSQC